MKKWSRSLLIVIGIIILAVFITLSYWFRWEWTGFIERIGPDVPQYQPTKNLWDWLQLLIIPVAIGFGTVWFTTHESRVSHEENKDNQREAALQTLVENISNLLLHEGLLKSQHEDEVRMVARLQILSALRRLDGKRKASALLFLYEAGLIEKSKSIITLGAAGMHAADLHGCDASDLFGASLYKSHIPYSDLSGANFSSVHLQEVFFEGGSLYKARFIRADLKNAEFLKVNLRGVDFTDADLSGVTIIASDLTGALVTQAQLNTAKDLRDTTMPNGSKHS